MEDFECHECDTVFEIEPWEDFECPQCGAVYYWDEMYDEEMGDEYPLILREND